MSCNPREVKFPLSVEEVKQLNLPKIYAKVSGYLIAKTIERNTKKVTDYIKVRLSRKKNTIVGLSNLINAFAVYMGTASYSGTQASQAGIILTTTQGTPVTLSFAQTPGITASSSGASVTFYANDNSSSSYTATAEQLNTLSANIPIELATNNIQITKQSNETLSLTWTINIDITVPSGLTYHYTTSAQPGGFNSCSSPGNPTCANYPDFLYFGCNCSITGLSQQLSTQSLVTTQLFTDMFYNKYNKSGDSGLVLTTSNTVYIYAPYCNKYFMAGINNNSANYVVSGGYCSAYLLNSPYLNVLYLQLYYASQPAKYIGVQITYSA